MRLGGSEDRHSPISEQFCKGLIQVVCENLDAFAASPTDLGRTSVVIHTIKAGVTRPSDTSSVQIHSLDGNI